MSMSHGGSILPGGKAKNAGLYDATHTLLVWSDAKLSSQVRGLHRSSELVVLVDTGQTCEMEHEALLAHFLRPSWSSLGVGCFRRRLISFGTFWATANTVHMVIDAQRKEHPYADPFF